MNKKEACLCLPHIECGQGSPKIIDVKEEVAVPVYGLLRGYFTFKNGAQWK